MPEIKNKALQSHLKDAEKSGFSPIYLIYGEEALCKTAFHHLLDALLPASERGMNYEPVDNDDVYEAIERVNTFSLMPGTKVVTLPDSRVFYSKTDEKSIAEKAKEAYDADDMKKAAKYIASILGLLNLSFEDVSSKASRIQNLKLDLEEFGDDTWLDQIISYCTENKVSVLAPKDNAGDLQKAVEKGFPPGNHLIITADIADKRRGLFKAIGKLGVIIDCSVPKGNRMADKKEQEAVLNEQMREILARSKKKIDRDAYQSLYEMTGFDLRTFSSNLEKLVHYAGQRKNITVQDVDAVLKRTRQDPIYELTNAVSDRNAGDALFFLNSLLSAGFFPLQVLGAIVNQIRKVFLVKGFTESTAGKAWAPRMPYQDFQNRMMPAIRKYDESLINQLEEWETMLSKTDGSDEAKKKPGKKKKSVPSTDVLIAKNPNNPYPVYQMFLKSEKFTMAELMEAIECLSEADLKLKTSGQNPKLVLEKAIFKIVSRGL